MAEISRKNSLNKAQGILRLNTQIQIRPLLKLYALILGNTNVRILSLVWYQILINQS